MTAPDGTSLAADFPCLAGLSPELSREVERQGMPVRFSAGHVLFDVGQACQALPLVREGVIRVVRRAESGREIRLYQVAPGEICIVTLSCLLGADIYPATAIAERDVAALALPRPLFMTLLEGHAPFRERVFHLFAERLSGLMQLVEEVAFRKLDQRLAAWLTAHAPEARCSHQAIADDLGSVREIVSRLLKQFEDEGWVRLGRERVEVLDAGALSRLARPGG
jgi:CRP/FNR family transcriptional regulator